MSENANRSQKRQVAVVTGASSGIGLAAAKLLAESGWSVGMVDIDDAALRVARESIDADAVATYRADVSVRADVDRYTNDVVETFGRLDAAVLNAGIFGTHGIMVWDYDEDVFDRVYDVNVKGTWHGLRAAIRHLRPQRSGSVVITSSIQGIRASVGCTAYTMSKHAVLGIARNAALELARYNVRVNTVHPGLVDTPMMERSRASKDPVHPDQLMRAQEKFIPFGRYAKPSEVAQLIGFLASDASSYCTGSTFVIDGGQTTFMGGKLADPDDL